MPQILICNQYHANCTGSVPTLSISAKRTWTVMISGTVSIITMFTAKPEKAHLRSWGSVT